MDTAYFLKNGVPVKDGGWNDSVRQDVNLGVVISFEKDGTKYVHLNNTDIKDGDEDFISAGYYPEFQVLDYLAKKRGAILLKNADRYANFVGFIFPDSDDEIISRKLIIKEDPVNSGLWRPFTRVYKFPLSADYQIIKSPKGRVTRIRYPDTAQIEDFQIELSDTGENFLNNNLSFANNHPVASQDTKNKMIIQMAKIAIILSNIDTDIFIYFTETQYQQVKNSHSTFWASQFSFNTNDSIDEIRQYKKNLLSFYRAAKLNTNKYKNIIGGGEKLSYIAVLLSANALSALTPLIRREALLEIYKHHLSTSDERIVWEKAVIRIINSFATSITNNQIGDVEDFFEWLTANNLNSGDTNESTSGQTLYEVFYDRMSTDFEITQQLISISNAVFNSNSKPDTTRDEYVQTLYDLWTHTKFNIIDPITYDLKPNSITYDDIGQTQIEFNNALSQSQQDAATWHYSVVAGYEKYPASEDPVCNVTDTCNEDFFYRDAPYAALAVPKQLDYRANKKFGYYTDNKDFLLEGNKIKITTKLPTGFLKGDDEYDDKVTYSYLTYGTYHLLQPVTLLNTDLEASTPLPFTTDTGVTDQDVNSDVPVFVLHHLASGNTRRNIETTIGLTLDAILTFSGIGNLTKLRALRIFGGSGGLSWMETLRITVGAVEFTAGAIAFFRNLVECDPNDTQCKNITAYVNLLALGAGGADALLQLKKWARRIILETGESTETGVRASLNTTIDDIAGSPVSQSTKDELISGFLKHGDNSYNLQELLTAFRARFTQLSTAQVNNLQALIPEEPLQKKFLVDFFDSSHINVDKLFGDLPLYVTNWRKIDSFSDLRSELLVLEQFDNFPSNILDDLKIELAHETRGPGVISRILDNPENLNKIAKEVLSDPAKAYGRRHDLDPDWYSWVRTHFFKFITKLGKKFESEIVTAGLAKKNNDYTFINNKIFTSISKNLDDYEMYDGVQLYFNNTDYFVADQLFIKWNNIGRKLVVEDIIVLETKLQDATDLSRRQEQFKNALKNSTLKDLIVRSKVKEGKYLENKDEIIKSGDKIYDSNNSIPISLFKVGDTENGDLITTVKNLLID